MQRTIPAGFKYRAAYLHGRPRHTAADDFSRKHPAMEPGHRAKIFAPFDALRGFGETVAAKETTYEPYRELGEEQREELSRKLLRLQTLVQNSRTARKNSVWIEAEYFCPCDDPDSEAYDILGRYRTVRGILKAVDPEHWQILIGELHIDLDDLYDIRDPEGKLFSEDDWD